MIVAMIWANVYVMSLINTELWPFFGPPIWLKLYKAVKSFDNLCQIDNNYKTNYRKMVLDVIRDIFM